MLNFLVILGIVIFYLVVGTVMTEYYASKWKKAGYSEEDIEEVLLATPGGWLFVKIRHGFKKLIWKFL